MRTTLRRFAWFLDVLSRVENRMDSYRSCLLRDHGNVKGAFKFNIVYIDLIGLKSFKLNEGTIEQHVQMVQLSARGRLIETARLIL